MLNITPEMRISIQHHNHRIRSKKADMRVLSIPEPEPHQKLSSEFRHGDTLIEYLPQKECEQKHLDCPKLYHRRCKTDDCILHFGLQNVDQLMFRLREISKQQMFNFFYHICFWDNSGRNRKKCNIFFKHKFQNIHYSA